MKLERDEFDVLIPSIPGGTPPPGTPPPGENPLGGVKEWPPKTPPPGSSKTPPPTDDSDDGGGDDSETDSEEEEGKSKDKEGKGKGKEVEIKIKKIGKGGMGSSLTPDQSKALQEEMGISLEIAGEDTARKLIQEAANNMDKLPKEAGGSQELLRRRIAELSRPKVDWKSALKRFIGKAMSSKEPIMPNRRFVSRGQYLSGDKRKYDALSAAAVACDTSGSMSQADITLILSETAGIINAKKIKKTEVIYFDAGIQNVDTLKFPNPTFDFDKATGGGGTTFAEPLQYMIDKFKKNQLELAIFCTDGVNSDHAAVDSLSVPNNFKKILVWVILDMPEYEPPFGAMVVHISKRDLE